MSVRVTRGTRALCVAAAASWHAGCATTYAARGLVLRVDQRARTVVVSHEPIVGYMGSMVMPFTVSNARHLQDVKPGDVIGFRLRGNSDRIDRIRFLSAAAADSGLTMTPAVSALVKTGELVPDFSLVDQHGSAVSLRSLRGSVVAVTFIYTRCPLPEYCPRVVANFNEVRKRFENRLGKDLTLLVVTFDPKYDTPDVLHNFAERYQANVKGWHFLSGVPDAIARVCASFGIEYWPDQGLITHTLQTAVIDREGKLRASVEGRGYTSRQIADLVGTVLER